MRLFFGSYATDVSIEKKGKISWITALINVG